MRDFLKILRLAQWLKNLMLFFPPFLGGLMFQPGLWRQGVLPFASFCLVSSATYIVNDIFDAQSDALHPRKKHRPLASGRLTRRSGFLYAGIVLAAGVTLGAMVPGSFLPILVFYLAVTVSYSLKLKEFPLIDVFCVSAGFLLRLEAGGAVFKVAVSEWLFLSVFFLALFLSTGKRLSEQLTLNLDANCHRKSLVSYPSGFLDGMLLLTGTAALVTYTMYVINRPMLIYTIPLCTFGLLRFMMLVKSTRYDDPTESLLRDAPLFLVGLMWTGLVGYATYFVP